MHLAIGISTPTGKACSKTDNLGRGDSLTSWVTLSELLDLLCLCVLVWKISVSQGPWGPSELLRVMLSTALTRSKHSSRSQPVARLLPITQVVAGPKPCPTCFQASMVGNR